MTLSMPSMASVGNDNSFLHFSYVPCLYVYNKVDTIPMEQLERLAAEPNSVIISCEWNMLLDHLVQRIWNTLDLIRVYTKKPGEYPDFQDGIVVRRGATVEHVCHAIHRNLPTVFKYALVWGASAKHQPQKVGIAHPVEDGDVIQIIKKK